MRDIVKKGDVACQHAFSRQDKTTLQVLCRVCTRCGQEELCCDNEHIDAKTARALMGRGA